MTQEPIQILEVRADEAQRSVTVTVAVTGDASQAIFVALGEQLDRRRRQPAESSEELLALRQQTARLEQFAPLASASRHAVVQLTEDDLRACLLDLTDYAQRVDGEHFQPADLRNRLQTIDQVTAVFWEANAAAAAASGELLTRVAT
jgi:hypothetical protein